MQVTIPERQGEPPLIRLMREASGAASWRGHTLGPWSTDEATRSMAACRNCSAQVVVDSDPFINAIDIMGDAVADNCPVED